MQCRAAVRRGGSLGGAGRPCEYGFEGLPMFCFICGGGCECWAALPSPASSAFFAISKYILAASRYSSDNRSSKVFLIAFRHAEDLLPAF